MPTPITVRPLRLSEKWEEGRTALQTWVEQVANALLPLVVQPSLELRVVRFIDSPPDPVAVPPGRIQGPPAGLWAVKLVDTSVPPSSAAGQLQVPSLTWRFDGTRTVIDAIDSATKAQLVVGHVYDLTVLLVGV